MHPRLLCLGRMSTVVKTAVSHVCWRHTRLKARLGDWRTTHHLDSLRLCYRRYHMVCG